MEEQLFAAILHGSGLTRAAGRTDAHYNGLWTHKHPINTMCNVELRIFAFRSRRSMGVWQIGARACRNAIWHIFKKLLVGTE